MKKLSLLLMLLAVFMIGKAQIITQSTTPSAIASLVPGYSQVTTYNTKTIAYTRSTPDVAPTPVDQDTTTEYIDKYDYANTISVNIANADGNVTSTSAGKVWTLRVSVPNALNIGLTFNQFNLSSAAEMFIFNEARTVIKGEIKKSYFTNITGLTTVPMSGNSIIIYIVELGNSGALQSTISIQQILAGYQNIDDVGSTGTAPGPSINCDPMVMCYQGKMATARAVARFFTGNGFACTGTLINNEANNGRAFFLTAFHCLDVNSGLFGGHPGNNILDASEIAALQHSSVQFQFWRTTCNGTVNNVGLEYPATTLRASSSTSDVVLLELVNAPGIGDGVNYAGWNRTTAEPNDDLSSIIHHPQTADMRVTFTKDVKTFFWNHDFWTAHYSSGTVDKGSSGSALFNENNQITGQLRSGWSNCNFTDFGDRYGKLSSSWGYANLKQWLSPVQNLQSMYSLDLYGLTIQGPAGLYCAGSGNVQFSVPGGLLGCTYLWTPGPNVQILSGQSTGTVTVKGTQTSNMNSYIKVTITDSKGYFKVLSITKNLTLSLSGPPVSVLGTPGYCNGSTQTWSLTATPPSGSNWHWTVDYLGTNSSIYIYNPYASSTNADVVGGGTVKLTYTDVCGVAQSPGGPTVYSSCHSPNAYTIKPNPAQSNLVVSTDNTESMIYGIKITDRSGLMKKIITCKPPVHSMKVNISNMDPGLYLLSVFNGHTWSSQQLVIQK